MTQPRFIAPSQSQFITSSTYRRAQLFSSPQLSRTFVAVLEQVRREFGFRLLGWVLMPEHFHLLILPPSPDAVSRIVQQLKQRTAARILRILGENRNHTWCARMLGRLRLPPAVHTRARYRVWQRRFYPFGVYTERKRLEKLAYMHNNPVKRKLVNSADEWPWSSFRFYQFGDATVLAMDC
jgi:REP-associated tyrosine transposase